MNEESAFLLAKEHPGDHLTMSQTVNHTSRYAIYLCPRLQSPLYQLGSGWLGRDPFTGEDLDPALPNGLSLEEWSSATESPRRYGFHATLKPPFRLAEGAVYNDLLGAACAFAKRYAAFEAPPLQVGTLGRFLALVLSQPSAELSEFAAACVSEFDRFRAPAGPRELALRLNGSLSPREREHVYRWGYPYVFDTWKFHMSLTGSLAAETLPQFEEILAERFTSVCSGPMVVDSICIFHEASAGSPFHLIDRLDLRPE
jgi:putative phosphonate metabolism protein